MDLVPVEVEMAIVPVIDTTMAEAQAHAKQYIAQTNAKPQPNETEGEYAARLANIILCSREMKIDKREANGEKQSRYRNDDDTGRGRSCGRST